MIDSASAQDATATAPSTTTEVVGSAESFDKQSLALRTALHYDASLDSPMKSLVALYQNADRVEELIGLYRGHIAQYADDAGAKAVLIRVLRELNRAEADELAQSAVQVHPDNALLHFLLYESRARRDDGRALDSLASAIDLETKAGRRDTWAEILLEEAGDGAGRELARAHMEKLRTAQGNTAESLLTLAERMHRHDFHELAFGTLQDAAKLKPDPETGVEIEMLSARAQAALGDRDAAGARLDLLLGRLAPDYWRRVEIMSLRVGMLSSEEDRRRLLADAKARHDAEPAAESPALEYAELLAVSGRRREALKVLGQAAESLPASERIEKRLLALLDQMNDLEALQTYLDARVTAYPERGDLRYRLVKVLYALGRGEEALSQLETVLAALDPEEADRRLLDLARHLRRGNLYLAAAALYQRIIDAQPDRFDVIRELAETHLALEDRAAARRSLRDLPVADAAIENFLDLVQFMTAEDFLPEAGAALEARLEQSPENLELRLQLATVLSRGGDRARTESLIAEARELTDTPARYRTWLEAALEAHGLFGDEAAFFDAEQFRLLTGEDTAQWTADRIENFLTFCELGEEKQMEDRVSQALRVQLEDASLPGDLRLRLRRLLVKALERSPERAGEMESQLQQLAKEDPGRAGEYDLRRALLYHSLQRTDLAGAALESVDVGAVEDPKLLKAAYLVFVEYGMPDAARLSLERVTQREPSDLVSWEKRLSLLAAMGQEEELRKAIRQLLADSERINLGPDSLESLRWHLLDSLWRSISRLLSSAQPEDLAASPPLLDAVDREARVEADRLWSLWARAYALNGLGHVEARDAVVGELVDLAGAVVGEDRNIVFPDGLSIALTAGVELLREPLPGTAAAAVEDAEGPLAGGEIAWAFEADPRSRILQLAVAGGDDLLVLDDLGTVYRVDRKTGKLLWRERHGHTAPSTQATSTSGAGGITISNSYYQIQQQGGTITVQQLMAPYQAVTLGGGGQGVAQDLRLIKRPGRMTVDPTGTLFLLPVGRVLEARRVEDGSLAWSAELGRGSSAGDEGSEPGVARPEMRLELADDHVLAFLPDASMLASIDLGTGKLRWERRIDENPTGRNGLGIHSLNSGASLREGKVFVYGAESLILDAVDGSVIWRFDGGDVRTFPVGLMERTAEKAPGDAPTPAATGLPTARPGYLDHLTPMEDRAAAVKRFLQYQGALVAPAVHWSAARLSQSSPAMAEIVGGDRLLLFGEGGFRAISLRLPLASTFHSASGVYLGSSGSQAWFLDGARLHRLDLAGGGEAFVSLESITTGETPARAVLSGGRLYAIGDSGVKVVNAWSGDTIADWGWTEAFDRYRQRLAIAPSGAAQAVWQGTIQPGPTAVSYCLPMRDLVEGDTLFTLVGDRAVVAWRSADAAPAR